MSGFLVAAAEAIRGLQCQVLAANEFLAGAVGRFNPVTRTTAPIVLNGIRRLLGCDDAGDYVDPPPPFTGGQCDVLYLFDVVGTVPQGVNGFGECQGSQGLNTVAGVWGPILGFSRGPGDCTGGPGGGTFTLLCTCFGSSGGQRLSSPVTIPVAQPAYTAVPSNIRRQDGQLDNCGDPPPEFPPPTDLPIDIDITFSPDVGPDITIPITVNFNPFEVNFNGDIRIPFDFNLGGIDFNGDVSFAPEVNVRINPPRFPRGTGDGTDGLPPGDPEDEVEPVEADEKIIGVVVNSQVVNDGLISSYSSPQIPDIFVPRLGSVKFAYSFGGATFWSRDIDIKDARTFIECPFSQGADAVVASPQIGVNMSAVPIRGYAIATTNDILQT